MDTGPANRIGPTVHCRHRRELPGQSFASWWHRRPGKSRLLCPTGWPRGSRPGRRNPQLESLLAAYCLRLILLDVFLAERLLELAAHHGLIVGAVAVHEFAHDDFAGHGEADFVGGGSVTNLALLFVVLHGLEAIAELVATLIKRRTG